MVVAATRTPPSPPLPRARVPSPGRGRVALAASLAVGACAFLALEPWHGPIVLALSEQHGVDAADLPALPVLALALALAWPAPGTARADRRRWPVAVAAVLLGALL